MAVILLIFILVAGGPAVLGYLLGHRAGYSKALEDQRAIQEQGSREFWKNYQMTMGGSNPNGGRDAR